jgi:hypothetical protein
MPVYLTFGICKDFPSSGVVQIDDSDNVSYIPRSACTKLQVGGISVKSTVICLINCAPIILRLVPFTFEGENMVSSLVSEPYTTTKAGAILLVDTDDKNKIRF